MVATRDFFFNPNVAAIFASQAKIGSIRVKAWLIPEKTATTTKSVKWHTLLDD